MRTRIVTALDVVTQRIKFAIVRWWERTCESQELISGDLDVLNNSETFDL